VKEELDFEEQSVFLLPLVVQDRGVESLSGRTILAVNVQDINDNFPTITVEVISGSAGVIEVAENFEDHGLTLALVTVTDLDSGRNGRVVCGLDGDSSTFQMVEIYRGQFHITAVSTFDREERNRYSLVIECRDLGDPPLSSSTVVNVTLVAWTSSKITANPTSYFLI